MLRVSVLVFSILVEEDYDTCLFVDQTPHVRFMFHINGMIAQPRLVYIYVFVFAQCDLLLYDYQLVDLYRPLFAQFRGFCRKVSQSISVKRFLASRFVVVAILILVIFIIMFSCYRLLLFDAFLAWMDRTIYCSSGSDAAEE